MANWENRSPPSRLQNRLVMPSSAIQIAIDEFQDATAFVRIMQVNNLDDWVIGKPIVGTLAALSEAGSELLVLEPVIDIKIGDLVYAEGIDTYALVRNVEQVYGETITFLSCELPGQVTRRPIPPGVQAVGEVDYAVTGPWISTKITIAPGLDRTMLSGTSVTFAAGEPIPLILPTPAQSHTDGLPA